MNHTLTVRGAYSTDFKNKKEILEHYNSNKDFQNLGINQGAYVNKKDAKRFKVAFLNVRYNNLSLLTSITAIFIKFLYLTFKYPTLNLLASFLFTYAPELIPKF